MDKKLQKAWLISLALIMFTIIGFGGNAMKKIAAETRIVFFEESPEGDSSIYEELNKLNANGRNLIVVAKRALPGTSKAVGELDLALTALSEAKGPKDSFPAYLEALSKMREILDKGENAEISDTDRGYLTSINANMDTIIYKIEHNSYNQRAQQGNAKLSGFPQSLIRMVRGIKPAELFAP